MKACIRIWGQQGVEEIIKEMKQFHDRKVVHPLLPKINSTAQEVKATTIGFLTFLKKKCNVIIKGRGCADRITQ